MKTESASIIQKDLEKFRIAPNMADYERISKNFSWEKAGNEMLELFDDGTFNAAYNAVDKHVKNGKGSKVALLFNEVSGGRREYTFEDMQTQTNKFANVLKNQGIQKGDRVFIFLPTIPERYFAFLGILKLGAIAGTMFSAFQEMALLDRLADSSAKIVVTTSELYPRIENIWKDLPNLERVIIVDREINPPPSSEDPSREGRRGSRESQVIDYQREMEKASSVFEVAHLKKDDYAYMLYTSGTTGKPKGVVHAHGDILQAMVTCKYVLDLHEDDIYWCIADLGWVTGVVYGCLGPWALGVTQVYYEGRFSPEAWYKVLQETHVTVWYNAPTAIRMLMGSMVSPGDYDLSSLRHLCSVGEPLNPEAVWWALEKFGLPFHDTWWQTETGGICITNYPMMDIKPGSMGKPLPGVRAAILDDTGVELGNEKEGNLVLKAETVWSLMKEIWGNKAKFDSYFKDGWYISGDRAYRDEDGYYWFVGRADDVINTSGERVGPFEVESALVSYGDVVEAGVIGKPDELRGEIIKAFVVVKPGVERNDELKEKLKQHVKKHLAGHAYPREIEFVERLPKTRSGKIMRRVLKAQELGLPIGDISTLEDY